MFVPKKPLPDGSSAGLRMVVDYRALNRVTVKDTYPLPNMQGLVEKAAGHECYSTLDATSSYHQFPVRPSDIEKTAFNSALGKYEFVVMPFGLSTAAATCQRYMDKIISKHSEYACAYIDDIIIFSRTMEEHQQHLEAVLTSLMEARISLNEKRRIFNQREVDYLGHHISGKGIAVQPDKVSAITETDPPKDQAAVRRYLGASGFYRRFMKDYARTALIMTRMANAKESEWTQKHQEAWLSLNDKLTTAPVSARYDGKKDISVATDASKDAIGAVLLQKDDDDQWATVTYLSKKLSKAEVNYPMWEKELLAIITACRSWRHYSLGRDLEFKTDHKALHYLMDTRDPTPRQARWIAFLTEYMPKLRYAAAGESIMKVPDYLSRISVAAIQLRTTILESYVDRDEKYRARNFQEKARIMGK